MVAQLVRREGEPQTGLAGDDDRDDREQRSARKPALAMVHVQDLDVLR